MKPQNKFKHIIISLGTALLLLVGLFLAVSILSTRPALAQGSIIYVDTDAPGPTHDGLSWTTAFTNVQDALNAATSGDEIWVAEGVYYPDEGAGQTDDDRSSTFQLKRNVALYGGFVATETLRDQRDWTVYVTVLSGDIDQSDTTDANGVVTDTANIGANNAYHVVSADNAANQNSILDGFTLTAGYADGTDDDNSGGGVFNDYGDPTLTNISIIGNEALFNGGGMYSYQGNLALSNITVSNNKAANSGGGIFANNGSLTLTDAVFNNNLVDQSGAGCGGGGIRFLYGELTLSNVTFRNNQALCGNSGAGAGLSSQQSSPGLSLTDVDFIDNYATNNGGAMSTFSDNITLTNVTFKGNRSYRGGGLYTQSSPGLSLTDVDFIDNYATSDGGAMSTYRDKITLANVTFKGNQGNSGGGLYTQRSPGLSLTDVDFVDNYATNYGGAMMTFRDKITLTNVTFKGNQGNSGGGLYTNGGINKLSNVVFSGNYAGYRGGGIYNTNTTNRLVTTTLVNITFSGNHAVSDGGAIRNESNTHTNTMVLRNCIVWGNSPNQLWGDGPYIVNYSDVQDGYAGTGNIDADPRFTALVDATGAPTSTGNLRLQAASPAIDAGDNDALPADTLDLDNDGNTTEKIPIDLDGNPRLLGAAVDMGAYEFTGPILTLHKSIMPAQVIPYHGTVTYTLALTNVGALSDTVTLTDTLPAGVAFGGWVISPTGTLRSDNAITWTGVVTAEEGITLVFTATHTGDYGDTITNTAYFSGTAQTGSSAATFSANKAPSADAGPDQIVAQNTTATLNGSASSDPDGHTLTYSWTQTGGSPQMVLNNNTVVSPTFTADTIGTFTFTLAVTDSLGLADPTPDAVVVTVIEDQKMVYLPLVLKNAP